MHHLRAKIEDLSKRAAEASVSSAGKNSNSNSSSNELLNSPTLETMAAPLNKTELSALDTKHRTSEGGSLLSESNNINNCDSWFQNDAVNLTLENDRIRREYAFLQRRFEKSLQVIGKLQQEAEKNR